MLSETKSHDPQILRNLIPLSTLSAPRFKKLCSASSVELGQKGSLLFRQGDSKNEFVYLLSGKVSLQAGDVEMDVIEGGTEASRFAIAHQIPRKVNAVAKTKIQFIRVDSSLIYSQEQGVSKSQTSPGYEVSDLPGESSDDWMTELLKSPIFERLPASNLQKVIMGLEEVPVIQGEEIFRQGDTGDYYYIIKSGQCTLTRKPNAHAKEITLAKLKTCDSFGEDALISNQPRNVSITMLTKGVILRLKKEKFLTLIKEPVIRYVNSHAIQNTVEQGGILIDLRSPDNFENFHLPDSKNIPFFSLRMQMHNFDTDFKPILVCDDGNTSQAAAFLLLREGFEAKVLRGGLKGLPKNSANSSSSLAKVPFKAEKSSIDTIQPKKADQSSSTREQTLPSDDKNIRTQLEHSLAQLKKDSEKRIDQLNAKLKQSKDSNHTLTQDVQALKQKIDGITNERKKTEGGTTAQQSADIEKIADLESNIQGLEQKQKEKDERYHKDLEKAFETTKTLEQDGQRLVQQHSKISVKLEGKNNLLKERKKEIEEQASIQRSVDSAKIAEREATIQSLEQTSKQKQETYHKSLKLETEKIKRVKQKGKELGQQFAQLQSGLDKEIADLKGQLNTQNKQSSIHRSGDSQKISELESTQKSLEQTLEQNEELYRNDQIAASEKIAQIKQEAEQLKRGYSESVSDVKKEMAELAVRLKETIAKAAAQQDADSEKIIELESANVSLVETLEQKDELYRKNQISASERITNLEEELVEVTELNSESTSKLEQELAGLKGHLKEFEEKTATRTYADSERIGILESTTKSLDQTLEEKDRQHQKDLNAASEKFSHLEADRAQLEQQHLESTSALDREINDLKTQLKENEEIASTKESANTGEIQRLADQLKSLEQTLTKKEEKYYKDLKESSEKFSQLAQDRTESIQQHTETTSSLEQEITCLKEQLELEGSKDTEETERLFQTDEADYKKQISAFKSKNDSLQINLTQKSEDIKALESNLHSLQEDNATLHSRLDKIQDGGPGTQSTETIESFQHRIGELEAQIAGTKQDKEEKENQVETLKQRSIELESVVKNLVDQSEQNGGSEHVASLKTELEMIRSHANSDFETITQQLKTAQSQTEQFKKALRQEKKRVAQLESELDQPLTVSTDLTATDEDIFSAEDTGLAPEKISGKTQKPKKLAFWKS